MDIQHLLKLLFPYLVILYVADCLTVVRPGHPLFTSRITGKTVLKNSGLTLTAILPVSWKVISHNVPVPLTESGIYLPRYSGSHHPRPWSEEDFVFVSYEDIETVSVEGRTLRVNGKWSISMPSANAARRIFSAVDEIRELPAQSREERIGAMVSAPAELGRAREELDGIRQDLAPLEFWSTFFFAGLFLLLPLTLSGRVLLPMTVPLAATLLSVYILILILFARTHAKFFPQGKWERVEAVAGLLLLPVGAAHAVSKLTRDVLSGFDHLTLAALLVPDRLGTVLRDELQRASFSARLGGPGDLVGYWQNRQGFMRNLAGISGVEISDGDFVRDRADEHAAGYCPLCGAQYREGLVMCSDCQVALKPI